MMIWKNKALHFNITKTWPGVFVFKLNVSDTYKNILAKCNKKSKEDATM